MARTVGLTAAIGVELLLSNGWGEGGVLIPVHKAIYEPALFLLEKEGIIFEERVQRFEQ